MTWATWVNFLVGQAGLICKLNYLDVTRIFNKSHAYVLWKRHWHLISEWPLDLVNTLNYVSLVWNQLTTLSCFEACSVQKFHSQEFCAWDASSASWRSLWHCFISDFSMSFYITFKKKTLAYGSQEGQMWITPRLLCGSVDQVRQQVWSTFNPGITIYSR